MAYLGNEVLHSRGDRHGVISVNADQRGTHLMAFVWVDRDRRYFISSGSSLSDGTVIQRTRWRQRKPGQEDPERTNVLVPQPKAAEIYYSACGKIDQHNRDRVDTLQIDRKIEVKDWSKRVNLTILSMIIVDTWKVYRRLTYADEASETQKQFYSRLMTEMIYNNYDQGYPTRTNIASTEDHSSPAQNAIHVRTGAPKAGISVHITPTKRMNGSHRIQRYCVECGRKTTDECSECADNDQHSSICHSNTERLCFANHIQSVHSDY